MRRQLTESQVREVLARAEEIHQGGSVTSDSVLHAAEEAGLPREAVEQALRERFQQMDEAPEKGELVFAKSGDGCFYVAEVLDPSTDGAFVEFFAGGKKKVGLEEMRHASFTPGLRLVVNWPGFGWSPARVTCYDSEKHEVTVRGWATTETLSIGDIRLEAEEGKGDREYTPGAFFFGLLSGGVVSAIVTWWLMR